MRVWELRPGSSQFCEQPRSAWRQLARSAVACLSAVTTGRRSAPEFFIVLRIVFSIAPHCSCASGFSLVSSRPCIVIGVNFPLQIHCILRDRPEKLIPIGAERPRLAISQAAHMRIRSVWQAWPATSFANAGAARCDWARGPHACAARHRVGAFAMHKLIMRMVQAGVLLCAAAALAATDERAAFLAGTSKSCPGCDLAGLDLSGRVFKRAKLEGAKLARATLTGTDFFRAGLAHADLAAAKLAGANLNLVDATWADLSGADLSHALLFEADLAGAKLTNANLQDARLGRARLNEADLSRARLTGADLTGARLAGAKLTGAMLRAVKLNGQNLRGMDLRGVDFATADMIEADLTGADLRGANFAGVDLSAANLHGADLRGARFDGARLTNAILSDTQRDGATFDGAIMPDGWDKE